MRLLSAALAVCLVALARAESPPSSPAVPQDLAIFLAQSSSTSTVFTMQYTRVTITKHRSTRSANLSQGRIPKIVVIDAAAKGLVCLPKGKLTKKDSSAAEAETVSRSTSTEEQKSYQVVGQGNGITATASSACVSATASVEAGDQSAASTASTCSSSDGESTGGGSSAAAASSGDSAAVDAAGENAEASATGADGTTVTKSSDIVEGYCECVAEYLCDEEGYINTFGAGIIDIRADTKKAVRKYDSRCKAGQTCCRHREGAERSAVAWLPGGCGQRAPFRLDKRIVGGEAVRIGENPWMVALLKEVTNEDGTSSEEYLCGGSLIADNIVLTGAHCVHAHQGEQLIARVGEWDTSVFDPIYPHQDVPVVRVIEHEKFNPKTLFNDVALLGLAEPVEIAPHVGPVCLPSAGLEYDATDCVAAGWGKESFENSVYSSILKEVPLNVVPSDQCQAALRTTRLGEYFRLHKSFLCAGGEPGVDTCKGDGGSPLVCRGPPTAEGEDTFVQVGIVAWGIGCGKDGVPGVYADVPKLMPWIQEHLAELTGDDADDGY